MKFRIILIVSFLFSLTGNSQTTDVLFVTDDDTFDSQMIGKIKLILDDTTITHRHFLSDESETFKNIPLGNHKVKFFTRFGDSIEINLNLKNKKKYYEFYFPKNLIYTKVSSNFSLTENWKNETDNNLQIFISTATDTGEKGERLIQFELSDNEVKALYWNQFDSYNKLYDTIIVTKSYPDTIINLINQFEMKQRQSDQSDCITHWGRSLNRVTIFNENKYKEFDFCTETDEEFIKLINLIRENIEKSSYY